MIICLFWEPKQHLEGLSALFGELIEVTYSFCCGHVFQETNSLRRTMQIVERSLLHRRAQSRVSSKPRTLASFSEIPYVP